MKKNVYQSDSGEIGFVSYIIIGICAVIIIMGLAWILGFMGNAAQVAQKEYYPDAMLKKYEWFKDASSQLDNKVATIKVFESKSDNLKKSYGNKTRDQWAREDREAYNNQQNEISGVKASYNSLAAEYNSQMVKFNWKFTNIGDLPPGADTPLPREYKPYITE